MNPGIPTSSSQVFSQTNDDQSVENFSFKEEPEIDDLKFDVTDTTGKINMVLAKLSQLTNQVDGNITQEEIEERCRQGIDLMK